MKFPEEKSERIKILVLAVMGLVVFLYVGVMYVAKPALAKRAESLETIEELRNEIDRARNKISQINRGRGKSIEALRKIVDISTVSNYVLHARLGNYLLGARDAIEAHTAAVGVTVENVHELGISQLPQGKGVKTDRAINVYTTRVTLQCGIHDLTQLVSLIEQSNPYVCVSSINIIAEGADPAIHNVSFEVQWPVWAVPGFETELATRLADLGKHKRAAGGEADAETEDTDSSNAEENDLPVDEDGVDSENEAAEGVPPA